MTDLTTVLPVPSPAEVRDEFLDMLTRDWLGPAGGEEEIIYEKTVRDRYLIGMLAPKNKSSAKDSDPSDEDDEPEVSVPVDEEGDLAAAGIDDEQGQAESVVPDVGETAAFIPSSLGVTVALGSDVRQIVVEVHYGRYVRENDEQDRRYWKRIPINFVSEPLLVRDGLIPLIPVEGDRGVHLIGVCRKGMGGYALTLFLVNGQTQLKKNKDEAWLFQPEILLYGADDAPIFAKRPLTRGLHDREDRAMEMLYRNHPEFAVGHGVGVHVDGDPDNPARAYKVTTRIIPMHQVSQMYARLVPGLVTDMATLAWTPCGGFSAALSPLTDAYEVWLHERVTEMEHPDSLLAPYVKEKIAAEQIGHGWRALERIRAGIALLDSDPDAAKAFQFANAAMSLQRVRSLFAEDVRREGKPDINALDVPENRSWRPFQLAFILLNLPAMLDPTHPDRSAPNPLDSPVDLLWFPTGGGKTEAYLGLTAFTLAIRRLQRDLFGFDGAGAGVAVIMRYTLRLLTLQQFQRATALICACETLRREDAATWGDEPFRIGLWVGSRSTPNYTDDSAEAIAQAHGGRLYGSGGTPIQLKHCPWCGSPIHPGRNIHVETVGDGAGRTFQYCSDAFGECPFGERRAKGEGLPIVVVDEEIYRRLPSLLIATVDKFAQMPWKGATQMLFGRVNGYCPRHGYRSPDLEDADSHPRKGKYPACRTVLLQNGLRPPDLIIQDELHLISGPLGTLVGLYETAVDTLCEWDLNGIQVHPKIVASTATIRRAQYQIHALFQRAVEIFPPSGLDAADSFFAQQDQNAPGRLYLGLCASGARLKSVLIRAYVTAMSAAQVLFNKYGAAADPYMTLVGYFNSVRELGGMMRVMDDAVQSRLRRMAERGLAKRVVFINNVEELTSRKTATEIPEILDKLEIPFGNPDAKKYPLDAVLATNMISVGVDVGRLGCMVVAGQPKATAEYIQATSRVGRRAPGVVIAVYNWTRPRDLSHYERFEHYHATFYQQVEALSVTPFAPRAFDRALAAVFVSLMRLSEYRLNADEDAGKLKGDDPLLNAVFERILQRASRVTGRQDTVNQVAERLNACKDDWLRQTRLPAAQLTYNSKRGAQIKLLSAPQEHTGDRQPFTCLNSMRDVELPIRLILDDFRMDEIL
jgi:DNA-binding Lrp family transcriptional regulator